MDTQPFASGSSFSPSVATTGDAFIGAKAPTRKKTAKLKSNFLLFIMYSRLFPIKSTIRLRWQRYEKIAISQNKYRKNIAVIYFLFSQGGNELSKRYCLSTSYRNAVWIRRNGVLINSFGVLFFAIGVSSERKCSSCLEKNPCCLRRMVIE